MLTQHSFFYESDIEHKASLAVRLQINALYNTLKGQVMAELSATQKRTDSFCNNKYDQERHYNVAYLLEVEEARRKIHSSSQEIILELTQFDKIHKNSPSEGLHHLMQYVEGLSALNFKLLFMVIFAGKIRKHVLPHIPDHRAALHTIENSNKPMLTDLQASLLKGFVGF